LLLNIADNQPAMDVLRKQIEANTKGEHQKASKEEIQKLLTDSFAAARKSMEAAQAPGLGRDVKVFDTATTRRGAYTFLDVHAAEHMGQLIAYCRTNGIVPPWSAGN
jgi:3-deoxy-D-manno-octulosonic acid (KDO) 8-phosphate synthase